MEPSTKRRRPARGANPPAKYGEAGLRRSTARNASSRASSSSTPARCFVSAMASPPGRRWWEASLIPRRNGRREGRGPANLAAAARSEGSPMAKTRNHSKGPIDDAKLRKEVERLEDDATPPTPAIYEVVRRLGKEEMERPAVSLWWSGVAGGLSISFSLLAEAILRMHLPDTPWRPLLVALGYPVGFLMVVLSRQ